MEKPRRRELTAEEKQEAERLNAAWLDYKTRNKGATQTWLAAESGLGTQGAVGQYLRGVIPLNVEALFSICRVIGANPLEISPRLVNRLVQADEAQREMNEIGLEMALAILNLGRGGSSDDSKGEVTGRRLHDDIPGAFRANHHRFRKIPAFGKAMAGIPDRIWEDGGYPVGASDVYAEVASADPNAFLVPVEGTSGVPRFNPGEYALVEPNTEPELEDDVLVRLIDGCTMLKRLLSRRGAIRFGSYNDPEVITVTPEEVVWMYYVAHPVPARKIKTRI